MPTDGRRRAGPVVLLVLLVLVLAGTAAGALTGGAGGSTTTAPAKVAGPPATPVACRARPGQYSAADLARVYRQVAPLFELGGQTIALGDGDVQLGLGTGEEGLAGLIEDHYGNAVALTVAGVPYCHGPGPNPACPAPPAADVPPAGLHLALTLSQADTSPVGSVGGSLLIRWTGRGSFSIDTSQPLLADTYQPVTGSVVGTFSGSTAGTGKLLRLRSGQSVRISVAVGTTRCGGLPGTAWPTGPTTCGSPWRRRVPARGPATCRRRRN